MKSKIKNFLNSKKSILLISFIIGLLCHYTVTSELMAFDNNNNNNNIMRPVRLSVLGDFDHPNDKDSSAFFEEKFSKNFLNQLKISEREDDSYKYIDIDNSGLPKDSLNIDIKDGLIIIRGRIKSTLTEEKNNIKSYSSFESSFNRRFEIPEGVDENKAEILKITSGKIDRVTIRLPLRKFTS